MGELDSNGTWTPIGSRSLLTARMLGWTPTARAKGPVNSTLLNKTRKLARDLEQVLISGQMWKGLLWEAGCPQGDLPSLVLLWNLNLEIWSLNFSNIFNQNYFLPKISFEKNTQCFSFTPKIQNWESKFAQTQGHRHSPIGHHNFSGSADLCKTYLWIGKVKREKPDPPFVFQSKFGQFEDSWQFPLLI